MPNDLRALRDDFVLLCREHSALEPAKHFQSWMKRPPNNGIGNKRVADLRDGHAVPASLVRGLVQFGLDTTAQGSTEVRRALIDYCTPRGLVVGPDTIPRVIDGISDVTEVADRDPMMAATDFVESLCRRVAAQGSAELRRSVRPVLTHGGPDALLQSIEWIGVEYGRQRSRSRISYSSARSIGERHIDIPLDQYGACALSWAQEYPWTVTHAMVATEPIGVTIALPLSVEAYGRLRSGAINSWELTTHDLRTASPFLFMEAIAMRPHPGVTGPRTPTEQLFCGMIAQCAKLSTVPGIGETVPLRLLTCGFAAVTENRAETLAFEPTGNSLPKTHLPLMERIVHVAARIEDASLCGNWRALQLHLTQADAAESSGSAQTIP